MYTEKKLSRLGFRTLMASKQFELISYDMTEGRVTGLRLTMTFQCYPSRKVIVFIFTGWPALVVPITAD